MNAADKDKEILESVVLIISAKLITAKPFKTKLNRILTGITKPKMSGIKHTRIQNNFLNELISFSIRTYF